MQREGAVKAILLLICTPIDHQQECKHFYLETLGILIKLPLKFIIYPGELKHYGLKPVLLTEFNLFTKLSPLFQAEGVAPSCLQ